VTVIYAGPGQLKDETVSVAWEAIRAEHQLPEPYVAAFSSLGPHKNMPRLVQAFHQACRDLPHHLVLIGHLPTGERGILAASNDGRAGRVHALGYVPAAHLAPILSHADLFAFPSLYEGFGLPILEAQQLGVPVVCSTAGSLPEVAGQSALFFDPLSIDQMAEAIRTCLSDRTLNGRLRQLGKENVARFSWEKTARAMLRVYESTHADQTER
jgi:glycosyltransferase involved in cell wall biosynthesis